MLQTEHISPSPTAAAKNTKIVEGGSVVVYIETRRCNIVEEDQLLLYILKSQ